jgi:hypothetical protein
LQEFIAHIFVLECAFALRSCALVDVRAVARVRFL